MSKSMPFVRGLLGALTVGALAVVAGCATTPEPQATSTPSASAAPETPEPYAGPIAFVGDELEWFLFSADEITAIFPNVGNVNAPDAAFEQISDGGGPNPDPEICSALIAEPSLGSIGTRSVSWTSSASDDQDGRLEVLQFADEEAVQSRMDQYVKAASQCGEFRFNNASTFDSTVLDSEDGVQAIAGSLVIDSGSYQSYQGYAAVGNVLVSFWQPFTGDSALDSDAVAASLMERASEAKTKLIDELTANPPVPAEVPSEVDASAPWSEWQITAAGVGPIRLGVELDEAIASVPDARVEEPEWEGGPTRLVSPDGNASVVLQRAEGQSAVSAIAVGFANVAGDRNHDGAALPSADGVRVGDPVAAAVEAFPEGTMLRVVSSAEDFYVWSTREGVLLRFRADRDVTEEGAVITGIQVEDATLQKAPVFG
ncbi:hypothetical protein AB0O87_13415 [Microbacterium sp. NPDC076768]|uniref:hypothetical protein n=1 Tax=Microbacterium sp. NPDC076768 TaxID=3154858 RepID=UPI0034147542